MPIKKALCVYGGGFRAMAGSSAFLSAAMAAERNDSSSDNYYQDTMGKLMANFSLVSSNSGGSWFSYALLLSSRFNEILKEMTETYMEVIPWEHKTGDVNPFYRSFLAISLQNITGWNEKEYDADSMGIVRRLKDKAADAVVGGILDDLALFVKYAAVEGLRQNTNIWDTMIEFLMAPLIQKSECPSWYQKIDLDWFINVSVHLPKPGPLTCSDPNSDGCNDDSATRYQQHGITKRIIRPDETSLKYISHCHGMQSMEPNYIGNYTKLSDDSFGRIDMVPAAFKVSSEMSEALDYNFISPSLKGLSVEYYIADCEVGDPISMDHIETTLNDPSFNFSRQKPLQFKQNASSSSDNEILKTEKQKGSSKYRFFEWLRNSSGGNDSTSNDIRRKMDEALYRVVASSAALGLSHITSNVEEAGEEMANENGISWLLQYLSDDAIDVGEDCDVDYYFGTLDALKNQYQQFHGVQPPDDILEWELKGETFAEQCDQFLAEGSLVCYDKSCVTKTDETSSGFPWSIFDSFYAGSSSCSKSECPSNAITLRQYADLFPLNIADGGFTDNTGISRAVMEGASHISCFAFNTGDFLGLFDSNEFQANHPMTYYFGIFNCIQEELDDLKKILDNTDDLAHLNAKSVHQNFKFVCRKTFRQFEGKDQLLKKLFMCKFQDVSIKHNPYYFDLDAKRNSGNEVVQELSIIFAIPQEEWKARGKSNLDTDLTNYGIWVEEIHSALQNGFAEDGEMGDNYVPTLDDKISSAIALRDFIFGTE
jgi:hypothetical protein